MEITSATHSIGASGAVLSTGEADVDMLPVDAEPEEAERADEDGDGSINLNTSELEAIGDQESDPETVKKLLDRSQSDDEVSITSLMYMMTKYLNDRSQSDENVNFKNLLLITLIMLLIEGRIKNQRALRMRK